MATVRTSQPKNLVMLNMGWYGKFVLPVDAAASIVSLLVNSGATKVETEHIDNRQVLRPVSPEWGIDPIKEPYLSDCPEQEDLRKDYFAWLKTKIDLVGKSYVFESYAEYLKAKEDGS